MDISFYLLVFLFGAIIGSFLNVVILRHGTGIDLFGRSFCFSCQKQLSWKDLFPVASFLSLGGKCRFCKSKISRQYIMIETITGIVFALIAWRLGGLEAFLSQTSFLPVFSYYAAFFSLLIVICAYDIKHKIIPDSFAFFVGLLAFFHLALSSPSALDLLAGPLLALPLAALWFFSEGRWIGLGDAKLMLGTGWFLGFGSGFAALILSFWIGAIVGLALVFVAKISRVFSWRKINIKSELPFAPFMIASCAIATFFPEAATFIRQLFF